MYLLAFVCMCTSTVVHMYITQDCFYSLMDKMVLLQIVAFIEIYEHAHMDTHTHTLTVGEMGELERQPGNAGRTKGKGDWSRRQPVSY